MSRSLLALDLALATGVAAWREGDAKPYVSRLDIAHTKEIGPRLASLFKWGLKITNERAITDIAVETPMTTGGNEAKIFWLVSAYGVVCMLGAQCKINVVPIRNDSMFINWCGTNTIKGDQRKTYSVLEAQRRGFPEIKDHNMADALAVLSLRCGQLGLTPPWDHRRSPGPLFTGSHPVGVKITKENKIAAAVLINRASSFDRDK